LQDIARVVTAITLHTDKQHNAVYRLTGPASVSHLDIARELSTTLDELVNCVHESNEELLV